MSDRFVHFYGRDGSPLTGVLTGRDYEEIEVTTPDGERHYMADEWLEHSHGEPNV